MFDRNEVPGIRFYSLDCDQPLAVAAARVLTGLPYFNAEMNWTVGDFIDYSCRRAKADEAVSYRYRGVGEGHEAEPALLEFF